MADNVLLEGLIDCAAHEWCDYEECGCEGSVCKYCLAVREVDGLTE